MKQAQSPVSSKPQRDGGGHRLGAVRAPTRTWGSELGNHGIAALFAEPVGPVDDAFEREADRAAEAVTAGLALGPAPFAGGSRGMIQRTCAECEQEEEEKIRRAPQEGAASQDTAPLEPAEAQPASDHPAETPGPDQPAADTTAAAPALLVDDAAEVSGSQMHKSEFLEVLRAEVHATADEGLAPSGRTSADCPWIAISFGHFENQDAAHVERALRRYAPEAGRAASASEYVSIVTARVRRSVDIWVGTGRVSGVPEGVPAGLVPRDGPSVVMAKARPGGVRASDPVSLRDQLGAGQPLPGDVRTRMESVFGAGFGGVRLHTDARGERLSNQLNARAFTVGRHVAFGPGEFRPGSIAGEALIAHELAHVVQQGGGERMADAGAAQGNVLHLEADADGAARGAVASLWGRATGMLAAAPAAMGPRLRSGLGLQRCAKSCGSDKDVEDAALKDASLPIPDPNHMGYNEILAKAGAPARETVLDLAALEQPDKSLSVEKFSGYPGDKARDVLALRTHATGTACEAWFTTLAGASMMLSDPYTSAPTHIQAYYFPGQTQRRALIIGGVHEFTEAQGSEAIEKLRAILTARSAAGPPPFFTTILVPRLFDKAQYDPKQGEGRRVRGGMGLDDKGKLEKDRFVETNRNFPLPGEGLEDARARGTSSSESPELVFRDAPASQPRAAKGAGTSIRLLAENRALIALIERFQPERIASVHAHGLNEVRNDKPVPPAKRLGDAPGIFVDPRSGAKDRESDQRLAAAMVREGRSRLGAAPIKGQPSDPFSGNVQQGLATTVEYSKGATHTEGNSLGDWAPVPVTKGGSARAGITTVTVELPQWKGKGDTAALDRVEQLDAGLLADVFLGDPATATPASGPTAP